MKRWMILLTVSLLLGVAGSGVIYSLAAASPSAESGLVRVMLEFDSLPMGRTGFVRIIGNDLAEVRAVFQDRIFYFYPASDGQGQVALLSAEMFGETGTYPLQIWVNYEDGTAERIDQDVIVSSGDFLRSELSLPNGLLPLLEQSVEDEEMERLFNIMDRFTPKRYWENSGFMPVSNEEEIGFFGTWRLYNGTYWRRHTGIDYKMPNNTPVQAVANGRVVLSETLPIRGGYVLIDHGWGIYSGYAHLGERLVVPGQWVRQSDVIALSGMNGRSTGPHLHWEIAVGGAWTSPKALLNLALGQTQK